MRREQLHAGKKHGHGEPLFHTTYEGNRYWSGWTHRRTPRQLLAECRSIIADLLKNHPQLKKRK